MNVRGRTAMGLRVGLLALALLLAGGPARGQADPLALQRQAVQRLDQLMEAARRSGNFQLDRAALDMLDRDLAQSNAQLGARGAPRELALGLIKQGSVARLMGQGERALQLYGAARQAAQRAGDAAIEADAMAWVAFAHANARQFQQAAALAREALPLAERAGDAKVLANVLDVLVNALVAVGDLNGAAAMVEREIAAAAAAGDPMSDYFALLNRSDIALKRAQQCDFRDAFEACRRAVEASRADMVRARELVERLGYAGLRAQTEALLKGIDDRAALIASRGRLTASVRSAGVFAPRRPEDVLVTGNFVPPGSHEGAPLMRTLIEQLQREQKAPGRLAAGDDATLRYIEGQLAEMEQRHDDALAVYLKAIAALERDRRALRDERARNS